VTSVVVYGGLPTIHYFSPDANSLDISLLALHRCLFREKTSDRNTAHIPCRTGLVISGCD
jgi:hypothetical protein